MPQKGSQQPKWDEGRPGACVSYAMNFPGGELAHQAV